MLSNPDGPFINVSRLNLSKYGAQPNLAKPLFEYLFYHENDVRTALQLAALATQAAQFKDWYWKLALGKCYYRYNYYYYCYYLPVSCFAAQVKFVAQFSV